MIPSNIKNDNTCTTSFTCFTERTRSTIIQICDSYHFTSTTTETVHTTTFSTCVFKNARSIVEYGIDTDGLLEYGKQNTDNDNCYTVREQFLCLFLGK